MHHLMNARIELIRRYIYIRSTRSERIIRIWTLHRRLHSRRRVHLPLDRITRRAIMNVLQTYTIRIRPYRADHERRQRRLILSLLHARTVLCRVSSLANKAIIKGHLHDATMITHRRISNLIRHRHRVAILTLQRPSAILTLRLP